MDTTYIDIDSTFRNRSEYPNPADFKINFDFQNNRNSISKANNIECDAYPYYQWQWYCEGVGTDGVGNTASDITGTISGSTIEGNAIEMIPSNDLSAPDGKTITANFTTSDNFFNGCLIENKNKVDTGVLINNGAGYSASGGSVAMTVDGTNALHQFNIDDVVINYKLQTLGIITAINATGTQITLGGGLLVTVLDDEPLYKLKKETSRISFYDSTDRVIDIHGKFSNETINNNDWNIINSTTTNSIFVPGGSNKEGDYVGDYYEAVMYRTGNNPTIHQFSKILAYDSTTKLLTLETNLNIANPGNRQNQSGAVYLNRIRKALPILPTSAADLSADNIPLISAVGVAGSIYNIVDIISGGSGYSFGDVLTIAGTTDAKFSVSRVDSNGAVKEITISYCGTGISGIVHKPTVSPAGGSNCEIRVALGTGIKVDTTIASTTDNEYTGQVLYVPSYTTSTAGTASTDPSAAQQFIPNKKTLNLDNTKPYEDEDHCTFEILGHFHTATGPNNIIVVKTVSDPTKFRANMEYNILPFSRDGVNNFVNNKYVNVNNLHTKYQIQLLHVTLPNTAIQTGPGGFIGNQPFVFIEFYSEGSNNRQLYNTNNPHLENVLFKCIVTDVANPSTIPFIKLKCAYPVSVNFDLNKNMYFRVVMPNGETFRTFKSDTIPPNCPNKDLQVSATFALTPIKEK